MRVEVRQAEDVILVDLQGRLVSGTGDKLLRDIMDELLAENWTKIILNLSEVSKIDSAGIGELVASIKTAEHLGSKVKLLNVHGQIRDILDLSQILPLLEIYDSEQSAIETFPDAT